MAGTKRNIRQYTWVCASRNVLTMARLDRFYVNHEMVNIAKNSYIRPSGFSDHHMIMQELTEICTTSRVQKV